MRPLLIILFFLISFGCANTVVEAVDTDDDAKPDLWVYRRGTVIMRTEADSNHDGSKDRWNYWGRNGRLKKYASLLSDGRESTVHFTKQKKVILDGFEVWKNEIDREKTYPDEAVRELTPKVYLYSKDNKIVLSQVDDNRDGAIDKTIVIKDFRTIDEYRGPYKGTIQELN